MADELCHHSEGLSPGPTPFLLARSVFCLHDGGGLAGQSRTALAPYVQLSNLIRRRPRLAANLSVNVGEPKTRRFSASQPQIAAERLLAVAELS